MATNDIVQLQQGIQSLALHVYERYREKGFSERAAKQDTVQVLLSVVENMLGDEPADSDIEFLLAPVAFLSTRWLDARARILSAEYNKAMEDNCRRHAEALYEVGKHLMGTSRILKLRTGGNSNGTTQEEGNT